ncbi:WXG100 family type VII secretion target [uncultured Corynebacterium sp.]|uniref:WXG100 family type VII secretion target n=1 Tax=uncultured Corynebacterium sp. TaxID=159447 RepID=UPI0025F757F1|nr:WXG100 family type VII secretion target [uncultured Corynebacterium sp.]
MPYAYDASVADTSAQDINQIVSALEATLDEIQGDVSKLASSWEGSEQEQYSGVQQKWAGAANQAKEILAQVKATLEENSQAVAETRSRVSNAISGN